MDSRIENRPAPRDATTRSIRDFSKFYASDLVGLPLLTRAGPSHPLASEGRLLRTSMQSEWVLIAIAAALLFAPLLLGALEH